MHLNPADCDMDFSFDLPTDHEVKLSGREATRKDQVEELKAIADKLRAANYQNVKEILSGARVPVIKCNDPNTGRELDVTVLNTLALRNSELLKQFGEFMVCRALVLSVKKWAKENGLIRDR